jgi:hypothetical protein
MASTMESWLLFGGLALTSLGAAFAGRLLSISPAWRLVSDLLALTLIFGVVLEVMGIGELATWLIALGAGVLVPLWALLLLRGATRGGGGGPGGRGPHTRGRPN